MKKFYEEFFYVPKHGKVREKVMLVRIAVSIVLILVCMAAMSISAYAYFSCNIASGISTLTAAHYSLEVETVPEGVTQENGYYILDNTSGETQQYTFVVKKSSGDNIAKVGFCEVEILSGMKDEQENLIPQSFYTEPIGTYGETTIEKRTIAISVKNGKSVKVRFIAQWGSPAESVQSKKVDENFVTAIENIRYEVPDVSVTSENPVTSTKPAGTASSDSPSNTTTTTDTATNVSTDSAAAPSTAGSGASSTDSGVSGSDTGTPTDTGAEPSSQTTDTATHSDVSTTDSSDSNAPTDSAGTTDTPVSSDTGTSSGSVSTDITETTDTSPEQSSAS